jgi:hypothetical protein
MAPTDITATLVASLRWRLGFFWDQGMSDLLLCVGGGTPPAGGRAMPTDRNPGR